MNEDQLTKITEFINETTYLLLNVADSFIEPPSLKRFVTPPQYASTQAKANLESNIDYLNVHLWKEDPKEFWQLQARRIVAGKNTAIPKAIFQLKEFVDKFYSTDKCFVITQNDFGLFQEAGFSDERINESYGNINYLQYVDGAVTKMALSDYSKLGIVTDGDKYVFDPDMIIDEYHRSVRPNVIGYNDFNFSSERMDKQEYTYKKWVKRINKKHASILFLDFGLMGFEQLQFDVQNIRKLVVNSMDMDASKGLQDDPNDPKATKQMQAEMETEWERLNQLNQILINGVKWENILTQLLNLKGI